jgi:hypothetical protein
VLTLLGLSMLAGAVSLAMRPVNASWALFGLAALGILVFVVALGAAKDGGGKAVLTFTGRSIALVASKGPSRGILTVRVNGVLVAIVDLRATFNRHKRVVWASSWATKVERTISVRVDGTPERPRVDLDALLTAS